MTQKQKIYFNSKLISTQFQNGQIDLRIKQRREGEYEIQKLSNDNWVNCRSRVNLEKDVKYVFRFQAESINEGDSFMIGLMRNSDIDSNYGQGEYLSCYLQYKNNYFLKCEDWGIQNLQKGNGEFQISREKIIELRVCLKEQILEIVDYPSYQYKLSLDDKYKQKLTEYDDLRLFIAIYHKGSTLILKNAVIVKEFVS